MIEILILEEENIIKNIRNLFRPKTELNYPAVKDIEYKKYGHRNKSLPGVEYLNQIRPY